jgi:outer membrane protein
MFVGGSFRFNTSNSEHNGANPPYKTSYYDLNLSPSLGKFISDKVAIGLDLNISLSGNKTDLNPETTSKSSGFGISPFLRYYAFKWNKFSVYGQGNIGLEFSNSSAKTGGITTDGPKNTLVYLSIYPGLSYDITDKLSLQTSINVLSFDYNYLITKVGSLKNTGSSFNIGAGLASIVSVNAISIGAIFKF